MIWGFWWILLAMFIRTSRFSNLLLRMSHFLGTSILRLKISLSEFEQSQSSSLISRNHIWNIWVWLHMTQLLNLRRFTSKFILNSLKIEVKSLIDTRLSCWVSNLILYLLKSKHNIIQWIKDSFISYEIKDHLSFFWCIQKLSIWLMLLNHVIWFYFASTVDAIEE
jgi:hypothetical protein